MFKLHKKILPNIILDMFPNFHHNYDTRQSTRGYLTYNIQCHTARRCTSIKYIGVKIWNNLLHLNYNCSIVTYKFNLKKHLLENL